MRSDFQLSQHAETIYRDRLKKRKKRRIVVILAWIVAFCTSYMLIIPTITLEKKPPCGMEEHTHDDGCFTVEEHLVCPREEHVHTDGCYEERDVLICATPEHPAHKHDETCYEDEKVLVCPLDESEDHKHGDECYEIRRVLVCGMEESEGHIHDDSCYEKRNVLVCGKDEHIHDGSCYESETVLSCGKEEHVHSEGCYASGGEDGEENGDVLPDAGLTGNRRDDVASVARSQLGYKESDEDFIRDADGERRGFTRYGDRYGDPYGDWNAAFVAFCMERAGVEEFPGYGKLTGEGICDEDLFIPPDGYTPQKGDVILTDGDEDGLPDCCGVVIETEDGDGALSISSIEGDLSDAVGIVTHLSDDDDIIGYIVLPEPVTDPDASDEATEIETGPAEEPNTTDGVVAETEEKKEETVSLSCVSESGIVVTVTGPASSFPNDGKGIQFVAEELSGSPDDLGPLEKYDELENALENGCGDCSVYLFDLKLVSDGVETEPTGPVCVSFEGFDKKIDSAYHLGETSTKLDTQETDGGEISFVTGHFSVYGLVSEPDRDITEPEDETMSLEVKKVWTDTWDEHDPVTMTLFLRGPDGETVPTGRALTLDEEGGWSDVFDELDAPSEGWSYFVVESPVDGYIAQYGSIKPAQSHEGEIWVPVPDNAMTDGGTYVFCTTYGNNRYLLNKGTGSDLSATTATYGGSIEIGGATYPSYLTNVASTAVFSAEAQGDGFLLRNTSSGQYLNGATFTSQIGSATPYIVDSNLLSCAKGYLYLNYWYGNAGFRLTSYRQRASSFQLYELFPEPEASAYTTTVKNTKIYPSQGIIDPKPELHKTIDYLGDDGNNPDTDLSGEDYYRLYLDVIGSHQPVDLLIVADASSSMNYPLSGGTTRQEALDRIVNGTILSGSGAGATRDSDGIIYNFLHMHPENNVAVTCFAGGWNEVNTGTYEGTKDRFNPITMDWTSLSGMPNGGASAQDCYASVVNTGTPGSANGTNYTSALLRAEEILSDPAIADNNHLKVMIFLTDGEPNRIIDEDGVIRAETGDHTYTENKFVSFVEAHPNMVPYIVGISPDANSGAAYNTLSSIAERAHLTYYPADDADYLQTVLHTIIERSKFSLVQIVDELSEYVEFYGENPDVKVVRTDSDGNETTVWENGGPTELNYDAGGNPIIQSVDYEPGDGDPSTGTVKVTFNPECLLDGENTFVLSFNVKLNEHAKEVFAADGYDATGDEGTDYGENGTSSGKDGFYSNDDAYITFTAYDIGHKTEYPHPVVQTTAVDFEIVKISASDGSMLPGAEFDLYRSVGQEYEGATLIPGLTGEFGKRINTAPLVTDEDGKTDVLTLVPGRYYLVERRAPDGYYPVSKPIVFDLTRDGVTSVAGEQYADNAEPFTDPDSDVVGIEVTNNTSHHLPDTGGSGEETVIFSGLLLTAGALICGYVVYKRERRALSKDTHIPER